MRLLHLFKYFAFVAVLIAGVGGMTNAFAADTTATANIHAAAHGDTASSDAAHGQASPAHGAAHADSHGGHGNAPHLDGSKLELFWVIPFAGMLLSIALFPLILPHFWHKNFGKVAAGWALLFLVPFTAVYGFEMALYEVVHAVALEYIPFIVLLLALFTVAGGVRVTGSLSGSPVVNTSILAMGTVLASLMGTTGAAMLLIRPLISANQWRTKKVHVIVFFIFLVANIGGSLTPLGDPPLFLGFLKGVHFFWPTTHMFLPMIIISSILLGMFFLLDSYLYKKEGTPPVIEAADKKVGLEGKVNILLLLGVVACVLMSGIWKPGISIDVYHVPVELQNIVRDVLLLVIAGLSLLLTNSDSRKANAFTWFPIVEVAKLFIGIFLTIIPAIAILKAGADGALSGVVHAVTAPDGEPINYMYFWLTGILSSFLDNAPTYLVFFNTAGGDAAHLMAEAVTLLAISCGAVFMGAMTYVGNAPNFMVRAIAEERGIAMPSFFGYMMWSGAFLFPLFGLVTLLFFI